MKQCDVVKYYPPFLKLLYFAFCIPGLLIIKQTKLTHEKYLMTNVTISAYQFKQTKRPMID